MRHNRVALCGMTLALVACSSAAIEEACPPFLQRELKVCAGTSTLHGVDVSYYQGTVNWTSVANDGQTFAIARVSDGTTHLDTKFAANWPGIKAAGLVRGVYQFFRPAQDPIAQADILINTVNQLGGWDALDLPPVLDLEAADGQTNAVVVQNALAWLQHVEQGTGRRPLVYTAAFMSSVIGNNFHAYPLWVANYGTTCPTMPSNWTEWVIWQDSSTGSVAGISGAVDTDIFNGNQAALTSFLQSSIVGSSPDAGPQPPLGACTSASITAGTLNVRPMPDTTMAPVGTLMMGDVVTVLETTTTGASVSGNTTWYRIDNGAGLTGWVSAFYADCIAREALDGGTPVSPDAGPVTRVDAGPVGLDGGTGLDAAAPAVDAAVARDAAVAVDAAVTPEVDAGPVDQGAQMGDGVKAVHKRCSLVP